MYINFSEGGFFKAHLIFPKVTLLLLFCSFLQTFHPTGLPIKATKNEICIRGTFFLFL